MRIGAQIGNYVLEKELARGGFGVVFVARQVQMGQRVAVKFLHRQWSEDHEQVQRFFNDARAATLADDPGIVRVMDAGFFEGYAYLLMEFLAGEPLAARLARAPMSPLMAITLMRQLARALSKVHAVGIVHRDLKPDNIFLVPDPEVPGGERVKILDFGIAKLADVSNTNKTATRAVFGTPAYMSPEQCRSAASVDPRSDIYSLGCILFEMTCGRPPFEGETGDLIGKHQYVAPPAPRSLNPSLPSDIEAIVLRALAKDPAARQQTMIELVGNLEVVAQRISSSGVAPKPKAERSQVVARTPPAAGPSAPITTLSSGAAEQRASSSRKTRSWAIGGVTLIVAGTAVGLVLASLHGGGPASPAAAHLEIVDAAGAPLAVPTPSAPPANPAPPAPGPPAKVYAMISSVPRGADVMIEGLTHAYTPAEVTGLDPTRTYKATFSKDCYADLVYQLAPNATTLNVVTVTLKPLDRVVHVSTSPSDALVLVDGHEVGHSPLDMHLGQGLDITQPHQLTFAKPGHEKTEVTLAPDAPCTMVKGVATVTMAQVLLVSTHATTPAVATPSRPSGETGTLTDAEVDKLLNAAMTDSLNDNASGARQKIEKVLKARPDDKNALGLGAMIACQAGDRGRATRYFNKLGNSDRKVVIAFCQKHGVRFDGQPSGLGDSRPPGSPPAPASTPPASPPAPRPQGGEDPYGSP